MEPTEDRPALLPALRVPPVLAGALAMVLGQLLLRMALVPQSFWWQDDYLHLDLARRVGWSSELLVRDYNDHLEILPNAAYWLLAQLTGSSWAPAAVLLLLLQLVASLLMVALLRELVGDRPVLLVALAIYLFTPILLVPLMWLAAGLEAWPLQIALLGTALGMVRFTRTGRWRWLVVAVAAHAFGLLAWEKALLVLPAVLGLHLLVLEPGASLRRRVALVGRRWPAWLVHLVLAGAYLVLYLSVVDGSERSGDASADYVRAITGSVFRVFVPGLAGGPWRSAGALNTLFADPGTVGAVLFGAVLTILAVVTVWRSGLAAVGVWAWVLAYLAVDVALLLVGRTSFLVLVARDPRYVADAVPVAVVAIGCLLALPRRGEREAAAPSRRTFTIAAAVAAVLVVSGLVTTLQLFGGLRHQPVRSYVESAIAQAGALAGSGVVDTPAPEEIVAKGSMSTVLRAMGREDVPFDQSGTNLRIFDPAGRLVAVAIDDIVLSRPGKRAGEQCGWVVRQEPVRLGRVPASGHPDVLQVAYLTGFDGVLTVTVGRQSASATLQPGLGDVTFVLRHPEGPIEATFEPDKKGAACLSDLVLGTARS
jgi:hypothetical protein